MACLLLCQFANARPVLTALRDKAAQRRSPLRWSPRETPLYPMLRFRPVLVLASVLVLVGCASIPELPCLPGEQRAVNELLYFGRAMPKGAVTAEEWSEFLRSVVTPRFPDGLTAWQASGQWKSADGTIAQELSYVLNLVHPENEPSEAAIRAVVSEYKSRFQQEAVLRVKGPVCASF